jgi:hypothetical protein
MTGIKEENTSVVTAGPVAKAEHEVKNYVSLCAQFISHFAELSMTA